MEKTPIFDLHGDLLLYLAKDSQRTAMDPEVRCSLPQLKAGNVEFQVLPIATVSGIVEETAQLIAYLNLEKQCPDFVARALAVENASGFCCEDEPLEQGLKRLDAWNAQGGPIFYISFTWNHENRFGGGAHTAVGLKPDGKVLLEHLHKRGMAVDLSHTSDALAHDIFNHIDAKGLDIPVIASHSNFRAICDVARNLPDELAKEVIARGGLLGMNVVRKFVGPNRVYFAKQLEHGLKLGAENHLCLGADFFCMEDLPPELQVPPEVGWFPGYDDASCYPALIQLWEEQLKLGPEVIKKICSINVHNYWTKTIEKYYNILLFK